MTWLNSTPLNVVINQLLSVGPVYIRSITLIFLISPPPTPTLLLPKPLLCHSGSIWWSRKDSGSWRDCLQREDFQEIRGGMCEWGEFKTVDIRKTLGRNVSLRVEDFLYIYQTYIFCFQYVDFSIGEWLGVFLEGCTQRFFCLRFFFFFPVRPRGDVSTAYLLLPLSSTWRQNFLS